MVGSEWTTPARQSEYQIDGGILLDEGTVDVAVPSPTAFLSEALVAAIGLRK